MTRPAAPRTDLADIPIEPEPGWDRSGEEEPPPDLRAAAVAVDALWDDPDPSDPDAADDLIWMTHDEEAMRDALRSLREALRDTRAATTTSRRGRRAGWPVVREQTFGRGTRQEMTLMVVEPPISENEIRGRQHWLDGHRAGKAGTELTCCGLIEAAHPTYPTASGHEFGLHHWLLRGCAACAVTITTLTGRSLTPATEEPK
jgi:hypothetical protein